MNSGMSKQTSDLLRAAKADAPPASARAEMWKGIEQSIAGVGTAAAAGSSLQAGSAGIGAMGSAKAAFIGALVGSAASIGVVAIVLHLSATKLTPSDPTPLDRRGTSQDHAGERFDAPSAMMPLRPAAAPADDLEIAPADAPGARTLDQPAPRGALDSRQREDILSREAALVTSGRHQLLAGNAEGALRDVRAARALPVRQLEPEVLTLEARALRALGRDDEAVEAEMTLRLRFPSKN
ncbi:MAG: hypothetical protein JWM74_1772 [Myxococcaceae bacterium]|jgi:Flp pilus assembly protein TadD|nr:hypothetical protein [Myxococcaceae bacterium]